MKPEKTFCTVGYKTRVLQSGIVLGHCFDVLKECCGDFKLAFFASRGYGENIFSATPGINILQREARVGIFLVAKDKQIPMTFCPFCASEIRVLESVRVGVIPKKKEITDGYTEFPLTANSIFSETFDAAERAE